MRYYLLSAWSIFDPLYYRFTRLTKLQDSGTARNIFRVRLTRYKGRDVILSDGTHITKNDLLVKVHLHNVRLLTDLYSIRSEVRKAKLIFYHVQRSLPGIEGYIRFHKRSNEIKGIIGITTLCTGSTRLGFEVFSISNLVYKWLKWATFLPITLLSANELPIKKLVKKPPPSYLFMSKDKLSKLYKI
ncbi:YkoP family protein [Mesobacillus zeae]|uniref:YkoP-like domain-containing protein n=1 Tax=Mesobacillus zeae TaxID=1917180 RepID=A0A398B8D5_9BACI|nr:hypothetical protein [Mesobacillus zeae]RID85761.1 hypothetical protein D1970_09475 [Mesobacillus zeae]